MKALHIATDGYIHNDALCVATNGYWCIEVVIDDKGNKKYIEIDSLGDVRSPIKNKDEFEILVLIKIFLICHT